MSNSDNIYCVCRICLAEGKVTNMKHMFNFSIKFNEEKISFTQLYSDYTDISIEADEELSPYICSKCETAVIIAFNFRKAVKESNDFLEHIFTKIRTFDQSNAGTAPDNRHKKVQELKEKLFSQKYCRFCYMESDVLSNIYDSKYKTSTFHSIFKSITSFAPPKNDLSNMICKSCENQMLQIYDGRINARKNDEYMKKSLQEALKAIKEGKLDVEKYRIPREKLNESFGSNEPVEGLMEPEFIKLEPVDPDDLEGALYKHEDFLVDSQSPTNDMLKNEGIMPF